ncbi:DUF4097 family beta strand repeat-containing protein [Levilactobacillus huananensis]|uniref:DUF4097 family beta strand repeat-containing protein n=1 Tax=Levilactobacillus huananensis TaxID=2486019 RepID=UPI000F789E2F|nr:DUF4097 family beta strand repeat-containing protein [Levilactobacillus huananensis]
MDDITMEIRTRLDDLFRNYTPSRALTELKEELVGDLTEAASERVNDGMQPDKAIAETISQIGDLDSLLKEVVEDSARDAATGRNRQRESQAKQPSQSSVHAGKLHITDNQVTWGDRVLVDSDKDRVDLGNLVQVEGDHVSVANGLIDVNGDHVTVNGQKPERTLVTSLKLVNTQTFAVTDLANVAIDYQDAAVKLGAASGKAIVVNEYMSRDNDRFHLRATRVGDTLTIQQGERPRLWPVHIRVEILLPTDLTGHVTVEAGNGSLEMSDFQSAIFLAAHATNGRVRLFHTAVDRLDLTVTNGAIKIDELKSTTYSIRSDNGAVTLGSLTGKGAVETINGAIRVTNQSGDLQVNSRNGGVRVDGMNGQLICIARNGGVRVKGLTGDGDIRARNGRVSAQVTGNMKVQSHGNVSLEVPVGQAYRFDLRNEEGTVRAPRDAHFKLDDRHHKIGCVGENPDMAVTVDSRQGTVEIN